MVSPTQQQAPVKYPSIPPATDLPSAIAAINALAAAFRILTNTGPTSSS